MQCVGIKLRTVKRPAEVNKTKVLSVRCCGGNGKQMVFGFDCPEVAIGREKEEPNLEVENP